MPFFESKRWTESALGDDLRPISFDHPLPHPLCPSLRQEWVEGWFRRDELTLLQRLGVSLGDSWHRSRGDRRRYHGSRRPDSWQPTLGGMVRSPPSSEPAPFDALGDEQRHHREADGHWVEWKASKRASRSLGGRLRSSPLEVEEHWKPWQEMALVKARPMSVRIVLFSGGKGCRTVLGGLRADWGSAVGFLAMGSITAGTGRRASSTSAAGSIASSTSIAASSSTGRSTTSCPSSAIQRKMNH